MLWCPVCGQPVVNTNEDVLYCVNLEGTHALEYNVYGVLQRTVEVPAPVVVPPTVTEPVKAEIPPAPTVKKVGSK